VNILFIDAKFPMFDRASADVRMFAIVKLLAEQGHTCSYYVFGATSQQKALGKAEVARYRVALENFGVRIFDNIGFEKILEAQSFDVVFFKYFYPAEKRISLVRIWQPWAKVIVDSVDLVYARLFSKAAVSGTTRDHDEAEETKRRELATYSAADLVITITREESELLQQKLPNLPTYLIPNIHKIPSQKRVETAVPSLIFIGVFTHEPNVDAVLYFAHEIWPRVQAEIPNVRWTIVGGHAPQQVLSLASDSIEVTGYVPETLPYLLRSWISIAPLRFGAGMKGKVGEAMAAGVPVVTTKFGIQGMGVVPGKHLLVAEDPARFADELIRLLKDKTLRDRIGRAGQDFIASRYSPEAVNRILQELFGDTSQIPGPKRLTFRMARKVLRQARTFADRYVLWRFKV